MPWSLAMGFNQKFEFRTADLHQCKRACQDGVTFEVYETMVRYADDTHKVKHRTEPYILKRLNETLEIHSKRHSKRHQICAVLGVCECRCTYDAAVNMYAATPVCSCRWNPLGLWSSLPQTRPTLRRRESRKKGRRQKESSSAEKWYHISFLFQKRLRRDKMHVHPAEG